MLHGAHVARVAGEDPPSHRQPFARDRQPDDDLRRILAAVLGVAALAQRIEAAPLPVEFRLVLLVDLEVQRCGVVEDQVHIGVHQVRHAEVERLLDLGLVLLEEVHGEVEVVQIELLARWEVDLFSQPLLPTVQLRVGAERAVGAWAAASWSETAG